MIWILRRLKVGIMATDAGDGYAGILMLGDARVTRLALCRCVTSDEWKARLRVALDHIGDPPRLARMATHALCTEIGFVDVGMAGFAVLLRAPEHQCGMTAFARRQAMRAGQNESRRFVIEF